MPRTLSRVTRLLVVALAVVGAVSIALPLLGGAIQWRPVWAIDDDYLAGREYALGRWEERVDCDLLSAAAYGRAWLAEQPGDGPAMDQIAFHEGCSDAEDGRGNRVASVGSRIGY